ncbi:MAG: hypothetical protein FIA94_11130 [Nitrospirae bacterium]|nr:hypothetical protein [Nitrospirota bacterium]
MKAEKGRAWGMPAAANFILGGAGAGLYLLISVRQLMGAGLSGTEGLLPAALVGLGFLSVSLESGRPWRGMYLLSNLRNSWMSIEVLSGSIFIAAVALDQFVPSPVLRATAACAAFELVMSHGFILYRARAMSAWNVAAIPFLFLSSGLVLGGGALFLLSGLQRSTLDTGILTVILVCLLADMTAWVLYVWYPRGKAFRSATAFLRRPLSLFVVTGLGHLVPLALLIWLAATAGGSADTGIRHLGISLTGFCMLAGGAAQKMELILGASL